MDNFLYFYQHLPLNLNPMIRIGLFSVSWYSIMYLVAFTVIYFLLRYRLNELKTQNSKLKATTKNLNLNKNLLIDFLIYAFIGLLIGARLGDVLFYNFGYYIQNPLAIVSPFDPATHEFVGIYGMSYHGGLIGVLIATFIFIKIHKISFWDISDFIIPAIPAGYFFGRIGNFINNELYGRMTDRPWGMYFKDYPFELRHPSQLYEAFLEGIVLFAILWSIRDKKIFKNRFLAVYLIGYAIFRFISEYFREPDSMALNLFRYLTLGQVFSLIMIITGLAILIFQKVKKLV